LFLFISFRAPLCHDKFYINKFSFLYTYSTHREADRVALAKPCASLWQSHVLRFGEANPQRSAMQAKQFGFAKELCWPPLRTSEKKLCFAPLRG
jgi:hypothetical protein